MGHAQSHTHAHVHTHARRVHANAHAHMHTHTGARMRHANSRPISLHQLLILRYIKYNTLDTIQYIRYNTIHCSGQLLGGGGVCARCTGWNRSPRGVMHHCTGCACKCASSLSLVLRLRVRCWCCAPGCPMALLGLSACDSGRCLLVGSWA